MRTSALTGVPTLALATAALAWAGPAAAQDVSQTTSHGERSEFQEIYEFGQGSTIYTVNINAVVGGEQIDNFASLSRYFISYSQEEIEQAVSGGYGVLVQGVPVTITSWTEPEAGDSWYDVIDTFTSTTYTFEILDFTSVQLTSGDGPDPFVPIGERGFCGDDGLSGATNFDAFDGQFATCEYAFDVFEVPAGTINTNTHTTTVYVDRYYQFQSIDDAYTNFYTIRPRTSQSESFGTLETLAYFESTIRNDSYSTQLTGVVGGDTLFDQSFDGAFDDPAVQAALGTLSQPVAYAVAGAPAVVTWSVPVLTGSGETLLSSSSETETTTATSQAVTTTETIGGAVAIGDRGACTSTGTSGVTSGLSPTGSFADCEGGVIYVLATDETNTNTHTTFITETTVNTLTTEDWLNWETFQLTGTPAFIGQIHSAVLDSLFADSGAFARRHGDALANRGGLGFGLWATAFAGRLESDSDSSGPGSSHSARGITGGATFRLSGIAGAGVAVSHGTTDSELDGLPESADLSHTQIGVAAELSPGVWRLRAAAGRGWGEIDTARGGGDNRAGYDASTWFASLEAGPQFGVGLLSIRPLAALEWDRVTLGSFVESGPIALAGGKDSRSRTAVALGAEVGARWTLPGGPGVRLWADARAGQVVDGKHRSRTVVFADGPDGSLQVTSASEAGTYAEGRAGISLITAGGLGFHLGGEARTGKGENGWRATAGVSAAF